MASLEKHRDDIFFSSCLVNQDNLYFFTDGTFRPIKYDLSKNVGEYLVEYKCLDGFAKGNLEKIFLYDDYIFAVKNTGEKVVRITLKDKSFISIPISASYMPTDNFALIAMYNNAIFCFCRTNNKVIIVDCDSLTVNEQQLLSLSDDGYKIGTIYEEHVYLFPKSGDKFLIYDLNERLYKQSYLSKEFSSISNVVSTKSNLYILERSGDLNLIDHNSFELIKSLKVGNEGAYGFIVICRNVIILLPSLGEDIMILDYSLETYHIYNEYPSDFSYKKVDGKSKYYYPYEDENYYYFAKRLANYFLKIDKNSGELKWIKIDVAVSELFIANELKNRKVLSENNNINLTEFINVLKKD